MSRLELYVDAPSGRRRVTVDPDRPLGQGGEARVFDLGDGTVAKVFHRPDDALLQGDPTEQEAARRRLALQQDKLPAFPKMPPEVVAPVTLVRDGAGPRAKIAGYVMPKVSGEVLLRYSQPRFRQSVPQEQATEILRVLRAAVESVHRAGVVLGDFNDKNVLVDGAAVRLVDADSMQFGRFPCATYTTTFVDPLVCEADPQSGAPTLAHPHTTDTDWYAFATMVMRTLLYVDAYGGVYAAPAGKPKVLHAARPMHRITVWSPGVTYPRPARPYGILGDDLLQHLHEVYERDRRGPFPAPLLDHMRWTTCSACGTEHARPRCPGVGCGTAAPAVAPVTQVTKVSGDVKATVVHQGRGVVLRVEGNRKKLTYLYHEGSEFRREDGGAALGGTPTHLLRYRCAGGSTYFASGDRVLEMQQGRPVVQHAVDVVDGVPVFQATTDHVYYTRDDALWRYGVRRGIDMGPDRIGDVISGQTRFWVGDEFGLGFYRAGGMTVGFTFRLDTCGICDSVKIVVKGGLLDATCVFGGDHAWFFTSAQEGPRRVNRCQVVRGTGAVVASAEAEVGDGTWLGSIRGHAVLGGVSPMLLAPTDAGLTRVEVTGSTLAATKSFPSTAPYVDAGCRLVVADGLYVVSADGRKITKLELLKT